MILLDYYCQCIHISQFNGGQPEADFILLGGGLLCEDNSELELKKIQIHNMKGEKFETHEPLPGGKGITKRRYGVALWGEQDVWICWG